MGQAQRPKRKGRQLGLTEQQQEKPPRWETLPEESRREVVALVAKLLRNEIATTEEVADE